MVRRPPRTSPPTRFLPSLPAADLAATRDFYVRDLGLRPEVEAPGLLRIRVGTATVEFRQQDGTTRGNGDRDGSMRLTFLCPDPGGLLIRLRALGVEVDVPPSPTGSVLFYARDPDGRLVAFTEAEPGDDQ